MSQPKARPIALALIVGALAVVAGWLDFRYGWITLAFDFVAHQFYEVPIVAAVRRPSQLLLTRWHLAIFAAYLTLGLAIGPWLSRHGRAWLTVFGAGYVIRAIVWICGSNLPLVPGDSCHYLEVATSVLRGEGPVMHYVHSFFIDYPHPRGWEYPQRLGHAAGRLCAARAPSGSPAWARTAASRAASWWRRLAASSSISRRCRRSTSSPGGDTAAGSPSGRWPRSPSFRSTRSMLGSSSGRTWWRSSRSWRSGC